MPKASRRALTLRFGIASTLTVIVLVACGSDDSTTPATTVTGSAGSAGGPSVKSISHFRQL